MDGDINARAPSSAPFGKCTEEVKFFLDESSKDALSAVAFACGKPVSEYIRDLVHIHLHGQAGVLRARMAGRE